MSFIEECPSQKVGSLLLLVLRNPVELSPFLYMSSAKFEILTSFTVLYNKSSSRLADHGAAKKSRFRVHTMV
jgi:hypothetical protein